MILFLHSGTASKKIVVSEQGRSRRTFLGRAISSAKDACARRGVWRQSPLDVNGVIMQFQRKTLSA